MKKKTNAYVEAIQKEYAWADERSDKSVLGPLWSAGYLAGLNAALKIVKNVANSQ